VSQTRWPCGVRRRPRCIIMAACGTAPRRRRNGRAPALRTGSLCFLHVRGRPMRLSRPRRCIALASAASAWRHPAQEPPAAQRTEGGEPLLDRGMTGLSRASICHRRLGPATPLGRGGSTTPTSFEGQRLASRCALPAHVARAAGRTRSLGRAAAGRSKSVPIGFGLLRGHRHRREMRCARDQDWSSSSKV